MSNRTFWKTVKPFLTNKGCMANDCISIALVEISSESKPSSLGNCEDSTQDEVTVDKIISKYSAHPSVQKIKREFSQDK